MNQTAVDWLWRWIMDNPFGSFEDGVNAYNKAKEMEKEQIIDAYNNGSIDKKPWQNYTPEEYYKETYK